MAQDTGKYVCVRDYRTNPNITDNQNRLQEAMWNLYNEARCEYINKEPNAPRRDDLIYMYLNLVERRRKEHLLVDEDFIIEDGDLYGIDYTKL
ncbi:MAG: hypothetical protein PHR07_09300 [Acidaminococcaceae bacterium]|nr:hypothetical protein [Acidaminococcaceae bacterium]